MSTSALWFLLIGFLLGNGMPHFAFGAAGKIFRTPFGRESSSRRNVGWGLFNFLLATGLVLWRLDAAARPSFPTGWLLAGGADVWACH